MSYVYNARTRVTITTTTSDNESYDIKQILFIIIISYLKLVRDGYFLFFLLNANVFVEVLRRSGVDFRSDTEVEFRIRHS